MDRLGGIIVLTVLLYLIYKLSKAEQQIDTLGLAVSALLNNEAKKNQKPVAPQSALNVENKESDKINNDEGLV